MYKKALGVVVLLGFVFCTQLGLAQVSTGTISGVVRDASEAVIPGATVTVKNVDTGMTRTVTTDEQGRYSAPDLAVGAYEMQAGLSGFQTAVRSGFTLQVGQKAAVDFSLQVGEVSSKIVVTGEAPLVEATRSDVSGVIEARQVSDLPLNGRSYLQLGLLQPGMVATRNSSTLSFGGQQTVLAVGGSQSTAGLYLLDGTDISDWRQATTPGGASGMAVGVDMIREFRVLTSSFSAEYGRTTGGVLAVVSKGGTNELHGSAFEFIRNDKLDARNFFDGEIPPFKRNQFGGTVGGRIVKDKTFFLVSYEGLRERLSATSVAIVPNLASRQAAVAAVRPFLILYPLPTGQDFGNGTAQWQGSGLQPTREDFFSGRVDHNFSEKDFLYGRYTFRDGFVSNPFGSTAVPGFPAIGEQRPQFTSAEETHVFSPTLINTFRASFNRSAKNSLVAPVLPGLSISLLPDPTGEGQMIIGGLTALGNRTSRPAGGPTNVFQAQDTVDFTRGRHSLKAGTDILRIQANYTYPFLFNGAYRFNSLATFLAGNATIYQGVLPGSDAYQGFRWSVYAFFVQDEFRALPSLTLNLGLRYEPYTNPTEVNNKLGALVNPLQDTAFTRVKTFFATNPGLKLFAPRFGFAWDPFQNGKLAIRGGFGIYYDRVFANQQQSNTNPPGATSIQVSNPPFPNPFAGGAQAGSLVSPQPVLSYPGYKYPYAMQWNFTVQREIVPSTVVTASYAGSRGVHTVVQGNLNLNKWIIQPDGRKFFPLGATRINPAFGEIALRIPEGNSHYHSLQLTLKRRLTHGLQLQAAYTFARSIDDGSTFGAGPVGNSPIALPDLYDTKRSRGLADIDVRQNFALNATYQLPFGGAKKRLGGWQLGGIVTLASGIPFTPILGLDQARSGFTTVSYGPDLVGKVKVDSRNVANYFNLNAFQLEPAGYFGNAGRNIIIGPGLVNVDFSVVKNTPLTERLNLQWRFEAFNLFNHANFKTPGDSGAGTGGGAVIFTSAAGIPVTTAGRLLATSTPSRQIQLALKFVF